MTSYGHRGLLRSQAHLINNVMFFHVLYLTLTDTFRSPLQCTDLKKDLKNVDTVTMGQTQKLTENYCVIFFIFFIFTLMSGLLSYKVHWKCQILYIIWWCMYLGSDSDTAEINHSYSVAFFYSGNVMHDNRRPQGTTR